MGIRRLSSCEAKEIQASLKPSSIQNSNLTPINYFNLLSNDVIRVIGLNMNPSMINLMSRTAKCFNDIFCHYKKDDENFTRVSLFWRAKVQRDFHQAVFEKPPTVKWWDYYLLCNDHPEVGKYLSESGFSAAQLFFLCRVLNESQIYGRPILSKEKAKEIFMIYYNLLERYGSLYYSEDNWHYEKHHTAIEFLKSDNGIAKDWDDDREFVRSMKKIGSIYRSDFRGHWIRHAGAARNSKEISKMVLNLRTSVIESLKPIILLLRKGSYFTNTIIWGSRSCRYLTNNESEINRQSILRVGTNGGSGFYDSKALKAIILFKFGKTIAEIEPITGTIHV